jgi:hypothetical protein
MNKESQQAVRKHTCAGGSSTFSWSFKFGWNVQFLSLFLFQIITSKTFLIIFSVKTFLNFSTLKMTSQFNARSLIHEMKNYYKILLWTKINTLIKSIFTYLMFENVNVKHYTTNGRQVRAVLLVDRIVEQLREHVRCRRLSDSYKKKVFLKEILVFPKVILAFLRKS